MNGTADQFRDAIAAAGFAPPSTIEPGRIHRYPGVGKANGNKAGWCKLFPDERGGMFGDHAAGIKEIWQAEHVKPLTFAEREAFRKHAERTRAEADAERGKENEEAAQEAAKLWARATPATEHAYLTRKGIKPHGARVDGETLLVPMRDSTGKLWNVERISANGEKKGIHRGRRTGLYHSFGKPDGVLYVVEGFATGASVHECSGQAVAVAFNAGNLAPVALSLREKYPELRIVMCADDDYRTEGNPGTTKAIEAARAVGGLVALPEFGEDRPEGATDFNDLAQHGGAAVVNSALAAATEPDEAGTPSAPSEAVAFDPAARLWPTLEPSTLYGLAGEIVRAIEPHTEADSAAILMQTLFAFGVYVGRNAFVAVEGDRHTPNLYMLLVGDTSKGRKGTSWGRVRQVFETLPGWPATVSGLSSGEGIKWNVRNATEGRGDKPGDPGVSDKRLLVIESEFAQVLRSSARPGVTLSATVREAWDSGNLRTLTKNDPVTATEAHVGIVGHITVDELRAELAETDRGNGFANRFLFVCVKRSKSLPFGGGTLDLRPFTDRLERAAERARQRGRIDMTQDARSVWAHVYPTLSEGHGGLFGAVTGRAEAQCLRLALVYALLDEADKIDAPHLFAALALWEYCEASARFIFGSTLGNVVADNILRSLRVAGKAGMTRTAIRDLFKRHESADRIGAALEFLKGRGLAAAFVDSTTIGRPPEIWRAANVAT